MVPFKTYSLAALLFFFGMSLFPVYAFPSGYPQPSHIFLLLGALVSLSWSQRIVNANDIFLLFCLLSLMCVRQLIFIAESHSRLSLIAPLIFFAFNYFIYSGVRVSSSMISRRVLYSALFYGTALSILLAIGILLVSGISFDAEAARVTGAFNNPNQLGYFAVLAGGIITFFFAINRTGIWLYLALFIPCVILVMASLSKAAMVAFIFYFGCLAAQRPKPALALFAVIVIVGVFALGFFESSSVMLRLQTIGRSADDTLVSRGYGPLLEPDLRIFYGWGEGYVETQIGHETHSTLGNILISYGLIAFFVLSSFLYVLFRRLWIYLGFFEAVSLFMPFLLYGIAHNGFRFSIFWVMLALFGSLREPVTRN